MSKFIFKWSFFWSFLAWKISWLWRSKLWDKNFISFSSWQIKTRFSFFTRIEHQNLSNFMVDINFCIIRVLWIYMFEHYDTFFWLKLKHPEILIITLSSKSTCCIGNVFWRYWNFFNRPITLSLCMHALESSFEVTTAHCNNCDFPFVKPGICWCYFIMEFEAPISKNKVTKSEPFKKTRLQGFLLVWYKSTPSTWNKTDQNSCKNPDQVFACVVMFIV